MTTVNTIDDLVRILDEHPEWLAAVRARLLTRELLDLPQAVVELDERLARIEENQAELARSQAALVSGHAQLAEALARLEARQDRMLDDLGWIKGRIVYDIVRNDAGLIAREMGFALEKSLVRADLMELSRGRDVSDLPRGALQSFHKADLVMQVADEAGAQHYIAVEASFTVNGRDSRRALRNAELLTRFTGLPASGAVAGVRYDWELKDRIEFEQLYWYEIPSEELEAE